MNTYPSRMGLADLTSSSSPNFTFKCTSNYTASTASSSNNSESSDKEEEQEQERNDDNQQTFSYSSQRDDANRQAFPYSSQHDDANLYGWYDDDEHTIKDKLDNSAVRDAWLNVTSKRISNTTNNNKKTSNHNIEVLNLWVNPSPEVSMKLSSGDDLRLLANSMSMSCCVSGFRIIQNIDNGDISAEFLTIFCYGSMSYQCWKSCAEFDELYKVVSHIHSLDRKMFGDTVDTWHQIQSYESWIRCLRVPYLIEKSIALGSFMQALFNESPTPGLLLYFVQNPNFRAIA